MDLPKNEFLRAARAGDSQIGLFLGLADPVSAELVATTGFDWLMIDGEHGPNDFASILAQLQALAPYASRIALRVPDHDVARLKRVLDLGAQTVMVPMVETADQAKILARAVRYPPQGIRGVGTAMARAARWNAIPDYLTRANGEICLIVQVESPEALKNLDEILAVDGVDAVFVGPSDLAANMGFVGAPGRAEVREAVVGALQKIRAAGKPAGVFAPDATAAEFFRQAGANFLLVGVDASLLRNACLNLLKIFKTVAGDGAAY